MTAASASLVEERDVLGALVSVLRTNDTVFGESSSAVLVDVRGSLEVLAASSHATEQLELFQTQVDEGPCVDAFRDNETVQVCGETDVVDRWPDFGTTMLANGFGGVHAVPLRWGGTALGAMGLFTVLPRPLDEDEAAVMRALADVATTLLAHDRHVEPESIAARLDVALDSRVVVEQAKGVLAEQHAVDLAEAYRMLLDLALQSGAGLHEVAASVLEDAYRPRS